MRSVAEFGDKPFVFWPPSMDPRHHSAVGQPAFLDCLNEERLPTAIRDQPFAARVSRLFGSRGPAAIRWSVVTTVVDAIERQPRGSLSHIVEKIGKRSPSLAYTDASTAVVLKLWRTGISAPSQHCRPNAVFRPISTMLRIAVGSGSLLPHLHREASAALRSALAQVAQRDNALIPAHTSAAPQRIAAVGALTFYQGKPSEMLSCSGVGASHGSV